MPSGNNELSQRGVYVLRAADLDPDGFQNMVAALPADLWQTAWVWLDGVDGFSFDYWPSIKGQVLWYRAGRLPSKRVVEGLLGQVIGGRIFQPQGELRWRVLPSLGPNRIRAVFLGRDELGKTLDPLEPRRELETLKPIRAEYRLWGQQTSNTPGEWIDLRIPHRFRYPTPANASGARIRAFLEVELWQDPSGQTHFVRFCQVIAKVV